MNVVTAGTKKVKPRPCNGVKPDAAASLYTHKVSPIPFDDTEITKNRPVKAGSSSACDGQQTAIFTIQKNDVICGRGGKAKNNEGNRRFRGWIKERRVKYSLAESIAEKSVIFEQVVNFINSQHPPVRFLMKHSSSTTNNPVWVQCSPIRVHNKIRQALREGAPEIRESHIGRRTVPGKKFRDRMKAHGLTYQDVALTTIGLTAAASHNSKLNSSIEAIQHLKTLPAPKSHYASMPLADSLVALEKVAKTTADSIQVGSRLRPASVYIPKIHEPHNPNGGKTKDVALGGTLLGPPSPPPPESAFDAWKSPAHLKAAGLPYKCTTLPDLPEKTNSISSKTPANATKIVDMKNFSLANNTTKAVPKEVDAKSSTANVPDAQKTPGVKAKKTEEGFPTPFWKVPPSLARNASAGIWSFDTNNTKGPAYDFHNARIPDPFLEEFEAKTISIVHSPLPIFMGHQSDGFVRSFFLPIAEQTTKSDGKSSSTTTKLQE